MKKLILSLSLIVMLGGCAGVKLGDGKIGGIPMTSNPLASALRQCAMFAELLTPGINISAAVQLARNATADNALGNTPQGAMRNCADLMDSIAD